MRPPASVTRTVNADELAVATVPDSTPPVDSVAPAGRLPLAIDHVFVPEPPVLASVNEKAEPATTEFSDAVVTTNGADTTSDSERVDVRTGVPLSVAVNAIDDVAPVLGVPDSTPLELNDMPAGTPVAVHVYVPDPPVAASVVL